MALIFQDGKSGNHLRQTTHTLGDSKASGCRTQMPGEEQNQTGIETGQRWLYFWNGCPSYQQTKMFRVRKAARVGVTLQAEEIRHVPHKDGIDTRHTVKWQQLDGTSSRYLVRLDDYF